VTGEGGQLQPTLRPGFEGRRETGGDKTDWRNEKGRRGSD
jgi:hypothetical protein